VFVGCLGPEASETLRNTVMVHDTEKLLDRVDLSLINSMPSAVCGASCG
jgi:hypothetical protein